MQSKLPSEPMTPTTDCVMSYRADEQQDETDDTDNDAGCNEDTDTGNKADNQQD
ncbi:MAG: hypothetical protein ABSG46_20225 [Candidatus Binataceae bacterium]